MQQRILDGKGNRNGKNDLCARAERERYNFDLTMFYENGFWNRRPDSIVINHRILYILELKRSSDRNVDFLRVKNEQHRSIIEAFKAAAPEWTFEQINFVAERRGAVVEDDFYNKREKLNVQAGKRDKILLAHVLRICEAHDTVMQSYYQQIHGSSGADATTSMENDGERWRASVRVNNSQSFCHQLLKKGEDRTKLE